MEYVMVDVEVDVEVEEEETSVAFARSVARASLQKYKALPRRGKPRTGEWTPLAAVVCKTKSGKDVYTCVGVAGV